MGGLEVADEALGGEGFADGDGVEPEGAAVVCAGFKDGGFEGWGDQAEALGEAFAVAVGGEHAPEPPGAGEDEAEGEERAVEGEEHCGG